MPFLAAVSAGAAVSKGLGVSFKRPTPRIYSYLPGTIEGIRSSIEGRGGNPNYPEPDPVSGVNRLWNSTNPGARQVWNNLLPSWSPTPEALAQIQRLDPNFRLAVSSDQPLAPPPVAEPSALQKVLDPLREAFDKGGSEADIRDAAAQAVERVGVGGGAEAARRIRGTSGPLDTLIAFSEKPGGTITLVVGGVLVVAIGAFLVGRR